MLRRKHILSMLSMSLVFALLAALAPIYRVRAVGTLYAAPTAQSNNYPRPWRYARSIVIDNTANPETLTDYQVLIQFDTQTLVAQGKMNPDGSDIRFTADFQTFLDYWIEKGIQGEFGIGEPDTKVWVKVPLIPGGGTTTIYLLYGNPTASPMSNIQDTFVFGDDFDDNSLDLSRWEVVLQGQGVLREQNQRLEHWSPMYTESDSMAISKQYFTGPMVLELRFCKGGYVYRWIGIGDDESGPNRAHMRILDWGPVLFEVIQDGVQYSQTVEDSFWSREYNPQYYVQVIRRPDGSFAFHSSVPGFEPGGHKSWSATFTQALPLDLPMQIYLIDHTWQGAFWLWDRYEDDVRVRKYTEPEPVATVSSQEVAIHHILYAASSAQGSGDCSSWDNACTLQTALAQALSGEEIWVQAGVHYPGSNRTDTFTLKSGVAVYGGFAGTETSRDQRDWQANPTILSGDIDRNDINTDGNFIAETWNDIQGNNAYHVVTGTGVNSSAILDGFVVTAGKADGLDYNMSGGGMINHPGSPKIVSTIFSGNFSNGNGGGMYNWNSSSPTLDNVIFVGNRSNASGGGTFNDWFNSIVMRNVSFYGNSATQGGGMFNYLYSQIYMNNGVFFDNSASYGGGVFNEHSQAILKNVTFFNNDASYGGGVFNKLSSNLTLVNSILWGDSAPNGPEIYNDSSNVYVTYSIVQGGWPGQGNLDADPLFVDPDNDNLRLGYGSPAIDAGNNSAVDVTIDLDGTPRIQDGNNDGTATVDMGAYETVPDTTAPTVTSLVRADADPTAAASVNFTVTFSETVTGVDASDFTLAMGGGLTGASVTGVSGSGTTYTVTVNTGTGSGTLGLNLADDDSIVDGANNPLGGVGTGNGDFGGETYTVDKDVPVVLSIVRANPNPTNTANVDFTVTFSEVVTGVDVSDFSLSISGITGASVTGVSGSGAVYTVTVNTGTGSGTIRLDLIDDDSIVDTAGNPLGGSGIGNGNFATGEEYTIITANRMYTFRSLAAQDGFVVESGENTNLGGAINTLGALRIGDNIYRKQIRSILSFATYSIPDNAIITKVTLKVKLQKIIGGGNPVNDFGGVLVDIRKGTFGAAALERTDFQAAASATLGPFTPVLDGGWYVFDLTAVADQINLLSINGKVTQIRLRFSLDDNDDAVANFLNLFSGNATVIANRPQLIIECYVP
ncbi:MAG: DUF2341 domain-containing protein [Anaerolineales bacterium]